MKKALKIIGVVIGGFCALLVTLGFIGMALDDEEPQAVKTETEAPKEEVKVSKEVYGNIVQGDRLTGEGGTTREEIVAILGEPDNSIESELNMNGRTIKNETCAWYTLTNGSISVTFSDGKVSYKLWMD